CSKTSMRPCPDIAIEQQLEPRKSRGRTMRIIPSLRNFLLAAALALPAAAQATVGVTEIASKAGDPVTVFYPSSAEEKPLKRGPFTFHFAAQGAPERGNGRLVLVSHGSGGAPWPHSDLARALVESGFVVAAPL